MKFSLIVKISLFCSSLLMMVGLPLSTHAHEDKMDHRLEISGLWARPIIIEGRPGAAYLTITNPTEKADRLVSASSSQAGRVEIHTHLMEDGVMKMREVEGIDIEAGATVNFQPGGYHLMIFNHEGVLKAGDMLPVTLTFEHAGDVALKAPVSMKAPK